MLEQVPGQLAAGPGVGRVDFHEPPQDRFDRRKAVVAQPLHPQLGQVEVVREASAGRRQVLQRRRPARGVGQQPGVRAVRVLGERLDLEHLRPQVARPHQVALRRRQVGGRAQPDRRLRPAARLLQQLLPAAEIAVERTRLRREEHQVPVVGAQRHRPVEHGERLGEPFELRQRAVQRPGGVPAPGAEAVEPPAQDRQRLGGPAAAAGGGEVRAGQVLVLVLQAKRVVVQLGRLVEMPLRPADVRQVVVVVSVDRVPANRLAQKVDRLRVLARVRTQLMGVALPADRIGRRPLGELPQEIDVFLAARQLAQARGAGELERDVVGKMLEQPLDALQHLGRVGIVVGQRPPGVERQRVVRGDRLHGAARLFRLLPLVPFQGALQRVQPVVQLRVGQGQAVDARRLGPGHEHFAARPGAPVAFEQAVGEELGLVPQRRVADDQRAPPGVVADARLQVRAGRLGGGQRERQPAVEHGDGAVPGDGELAHDPTVLLRPAPLGVMRRAGIRDRRRQLQMLARHVPEAAERGERCRGAGLVVLPHEAHAQDVPACVGRRALDVVNDLLVEIALHLPGVFERPVGFAEEVGDVAAARLEPLPQVVIEQRGEPFELIEAVPRLGVALELDLNAGELAPDGAALQPPAGRLQELHRLLVALLLDQEVGDPLHGRAIPRPDLQGVACQGNGVVAAVLQRAQRRPFEDDPGVDMPQRLGAGEPVLGGVEVAQPAQDGPVQGEPVRPALQRCVVRQLADAPQELPGGPGALTVGQVVGEVPAGLRVGRVRAVRVDEVPVPEPLAAEVARHAPGKDARVGAAPGLQRRDRLADLVGLQVPALVVERKDRLPLFGGEKGERFGIDGAHRRTSYTG